MEKTGSDERSCEKARGKNPSDAATLGENPDEVPLVFDGSVQEY
jgi:hypothetical protein